MAVKLCLYRFVQEGLNNAYRHAQASEKRLIARIEDKAVVIEVSDTGTGFLWDGANFPNGKLGLSGLRNRITILGGDFSLHTSLGCGTKISARFPLQIFQHRELRTPTERTYHQEAGL